MKKRFRAQTDGMRGGNGGGGPYRPRPRCPFFSARCKYRMRSGRNQAPEGRAAPADFGRRRPRRTDSGFPAREPARRKIRRLSPMSRPWLLVSAAGPVSRRGFCPWGSPDRSTRQSRKGRTGRIPRRGLPCWDHDRRTSDRHSATECACRGPACPPRNMPLVFPADVGASCAQAVAESRDGVGIEPGDVRVVRFLGAVAGMPSGGGIPPPIRTPDVSWATVSGRRPDFSRPGQNGPPAYLASVRIEPACLYPSGRTAS